MNLEFAQIDDFSPALGTEFSVAAGGVTLPLKLEEVRLLGHQRIGAKRQPFALLFRSPKGVTILPQATYSISHPDLGGTEIFMVPVGLADGGGVLYEAVFT